MKSQRIGGCPPLLLYFLLATVIITGAIFFLISSSIPLTRYSAGFSHDVFDLINAGDSTNLVQQKLGDPITTHSINYRKAFFYPDSGVRILLDNTNPNYYTVSEVKGLDNSGLIRLGQREDEVIRLLGKPIVEESIPGFEKWDFSASLLKNGSYKYYILIVDTRDKIVVEKASGYYFD